MTASSPRATIASSNQPGTCDPPRGGAYRARTPRRKRVFGISQGRDTNGPVDDAGGLETAIRALRQASEVTRRVQDSLQAGVLTRTKTDRSPVTVADFAAQAVIARELGTDFVGEENSDLLIDDVALRLEVLSAVRTVVSDLSETSLIEAVRRGEADPDPNGFWTVDPVDGTKGFVRGDHYCLALAYIRDGLPRIGVLACPRLGAGLGETNGAGAIAWATPEAAFIAELKNGAARALPLLTPKPNGAIRIAESFEAAHSDQSLGPSLLRACNLPPGPPLRLDSQVKYVTVARGDAQVLLRRPRGGYVERIWDHAAGSLIARAAGCVVTDLNGAALGFGHGRGLEANRGILVAPPTLHEELLDAARRLDA